jgi:antagonist of KipI
MNIDILRSSFLTTVQDLGRMGFREFGVSPGGALDSHALRVANLLVGNKESAAGIEITFGGVQLRFADERVVAWCGGEFDVRIGSTSLPAGHAGFVRAGDVLIFNQPKTGCRSWLGISGGIDVPLVLGSRSTDLRANFGGLDGRALRDGDEVPLGGNSERPKILIEKLREQKVANWKPPHDWSSPAKHEPVLRVICGSNSDRFNDVTIQRFTNDVFVVSADSNRMGARLEGPHLQRDHDVDLVSEGVAPGTIQVPPSGQPILLLGDCQTIGGYPKIAHVITVDLSVAAQLRAGDSVRFREISLAEAHRRLVERERYLEQFCRGIKLHFL